MSPASWVAFDAERFPIAFLSVDYYSRAQAQAEHPTCTIEYAEGEQRSRLLRQHAGICWS